MKIKEIKKIKYLTDGGQEVNSEEEAIAIDKILKNAKFKLGDKVLFTECDQGDYPDQDKYYLSSGVICRILVNKDNIYYDCGKNYSFKESELTLDNQHNKLKQYHEFKYRGYLKPYDRVVIIKYKKNTILYDKVYEIYKSELYKEDNNCYWYYNDSDILCTLCEGEFLFVNGCE